MVAGWDRPNVVGPPAVIAKTPRMLRPRNRRLRRGLFFAAAFVRPDMLINLIDGTPIFKSNGNEKFEVIDNGLPGWALTSGGHGLYWDPPAHIRPMEGNTGIGRGVSLAMYSTPNGNTPVGNVNQLHFLHNNTGSSPWISWGLGTSSYATALMFAVGSSLTVQLSSQDPDWGGTNMRVGSISGFDLSANDSRFEFYFNGDYETVVNGTFFADLAYGSTPRVAIGPDPARSGDNLHHHVHAAYMWDRRLGSDEAHLLTVDPWAPVRASPVYLRARRNVADPREYIGGEIIL